MSIVLLDGLDDRTELANQVDGNVPMLKNVIAILMLATAATACGASANIGGAHTAFCIGGASCGY